MAAMSIRNRNILILFFWVAAGTVVMFREALQYTTFGGASAPRSFRPPSGVSGAAKTSVRSWRQPSNPFYNADGSPGVQAKGAWMGVCAISALLTVAQVAVQAPFLAAIALTAILLGIATKEGSLKGGGLNFRGFPSIGGQKTTWSSWNAPRGNQQSSGSGQSVSFSSNSSLNNSWQNSVNSLSATSSSRPSSSFSWSGAGSSSYNGNWMPGGSSSQNSWQNKIFGRR